MSFVNRQDKAFDAESAMGDVALFRRQQPPGKVGGIGIIGQKLLKPGLREFEEAFVMPQRVVGIEADGGQIPRHCGAFPGQPFSNTVRTIYRQAEA